jgi:ribosomal protein L7/L12
VFSDDAERIDRLERQVQYLLRYVGVDAEIAAAGSAALPAGPPFAAACSPEIVALVGKGKPIQAIKAYRQITGASLKESKDVIDSLRFDLGLTRRRGGGTRRRG